MLYSCARMATVGVKGLMWLKVFITMQSFFHIVTLFTINTLHTGETTVLTLESGA